MRQYRRAFRHFGRLFRALEAEYAMAMRRLAFLVPLLFAGALYGCPFCQSPTGQEVHAGIFNDSFLPMLSTLLSPFLVIATLGGILFYYGGLIWPTKKQTEDH